MFTYKYINTDAKNIREVEWTINRIASYKNDIENSYDFMEEMRNEFKEADYDPELMDFDTFLKDKIWNKERIIEFIKNNALQFVSEMGKDVKWDLDHHRWDRLTKEFLELYPNDQDITLAMVRYGGKKMLDVLVENTNLLDDKDVRVKAYDTLIEEQNSKQEILKETILKENEYTQRIAEEKDEYVRTLSSEIDSQQSEKQKEDLEDRQDKEIELNQVMKRNEVLEGRIAKLEAMLGISNDEKEKAE